MAVTFTTSAGVVFTFRDGDVESIQSSIGTELDFDSMPMSTAEAAMLYDFNGVKKTIRLSGQLSSDGNNRLSSGSAITINEQRQWLEALINGSQSGLLFDSNYSSMYNGSTFTSSTVLFSALNFNEQTGNPNALPFDITLFVGSV